MYNDLNDNVIKLKNNVNELNDNVTNTANRIGNMFNNAQEDSAARYKMLEQLVEQMKISNAMRAIEHEYPNGFNKMDYGQAMTEEEQQERLARREQAQNMKELYGKLSARAIQDGMDLVGMQPKTAETKTPTKIKLNINTKQRGSEFDSITQTESEHVLGPCIQ